MSHNGRDYSFEYQLLDRLRMDCDYFLGYGNRREDRLWAGSVTEQISKMRELYVLLPEKPEWLSESDINEYEKKMSEEKVWRKDQYNGQVYFLYWQFSQSLSRRVNA